MKAPKPYKSPFGVVITSPDQSTKPPAQPREEPQATPVKAPGKGRQTLNVRLSTEERTKLSRIAQRLSGEGIDASLGDAVRWLIHQYKD